MPDLTDATGHSYSFEQPPGRIVCLVPSLTELLYYLGLDEEVVGITRFCIHPQHWFRTKTRVGGTKDVHLERIDALQPDLIIANKEENNREQVEALRANYRVWVTEINTLADALDMIRQLGTITHRREKAAQLADTIEKDFQSLPAWPRLPALYLIWRNPWMAAGADTFIDDLLSYAGFENVLKNEARYPVLSDARLQELNPPVVLLSSEPYPFGTAHIREIRELLPHAQILLADGELFSWYGSRLLQSPAGFRALRTPLK